MFARLTPPKTKITASTRMLIDMLERGTVPFETVKQFIDSNPDIQLDGVHPTHGFTPLHTCAFRGQHEALNYLLEKGAPIEITNNFQETPLHIAATYREVRCVEILLQKGARPDVKDWQGKSAIQAARTGPSLVPTTNGPAAGERVAAMLSSAIKQKTQRGSDGDNTATATKLRTIGNRLFTEGKFQQAIEAYTKSVDLLFDYRTCINRAIAYYRIDDFPPGFLDAQLATGMESGLAIGYLLQAFLFLVHRNFPRARIFCSAGMAKCQDSPKTEAFDAMQRMNEHLISKGITERVVNGPIRDIQARVDQGCPVIECNLCGKDIPADSGSCCPFCCCDPNGEDIGEPVRDLNLWPMFFKVYSDEEFAAMLPPKKKKRPCCHCGKTPEKTLKCGRCRSAVYCDASCQKAHWSQHKHQCNSERS